MSFFKPPTHIVFHEVGHAVMAYANRTEIKEIRAEILSHAGKVDLEKPAADEAHLLISIAGPVTQQIFCLDSVRDKRLKGVLFDSTLAHEWKHWKTMEATIAADRNGWREDLLDFYTAICKDIASCAERVPPFAKAEERTRRILADRRVADAVQTLANELTMRSRIPGDEVTSILAQFFAADLLNQL